MKQMNKFVVMCVCSMSLSAWAGGWTVSIQPQYRVGMSMDLKGAGYANDPSAAALLPGQNYRSGLSWHYAPRPNPGVVQPPTDDITQLADRTFDDGYVGVCPDTTVDAPYTWYWGWEDEGQYDSGSQQFTFTRESSTSSKGTYSDEAVGREAHSQTTVLFDEAISDSQDFSAPGLELTARYTLLAKENSSLELVLGVAGWWGEKVRFDEQTFAARVQEDRYNVYAARGYAYDYSGSYLETYVYNDPFAVAPSATPPYAHGYEYDDEGMNPMIDALPASRDVTQTGGSSSSEEIGYVQVRERVGGQRWSVANDVKVDADVNNTALRLGLAGARLLKKNLQLFVQPQLSINYVQASLDRVEWLTAVSDNGTATTLAEWRDSTDEEKWIMGLGLLGGINLPLGGRWFVEGSAGYEWMTEKPSFEVGPSTVEMDLSAFELSAGVGCSL